MNIPIAEKRFTIEASRETVWDLLGGVIFACMPMEKIDILSENAFNAEVRWRWKWGLSSMTLYCRGELVDNSPPGFLGCKVTAKSRWGIIKQQMKVTFALTPIDENKTEILCRALGEDMGMMERLVLIKMLRNLGDATLENIKGRLEQLV